MPKSKKPRKGRSHFRPPMSALFVSASYKNRVKQIFIDLNIKFLELAHRGMLGEQDIYCLRDSIGMAKIGIDSRLWIDFSGSAEELQLVDEAQDAFCSFYLRYLKTKNPTFTGDELKTLTRGVPIIIDFILDSLDAYPHRVLKEYFALRDLIKDEPPGVVTVTQDRILQAIQNAR